MKNRSFGFAAKFLLLIISYVSMVSSNIFDTPDVLKGNVDFWKKIYTDVSLSEGLLHDNTYPLVIYGKIALDKNEGRQRERRISVFKNEILASLSVMASQPESTWTGKETAILHLFEAHGNGRDGIAGAADRIRFQQGQKERFLEGLCRSGAYVDTIRSILAQYNIPPELAFLPHVESSFNANAYSKVGAAGLWQFMRSTGKMYMTINYSIDERRDPIASTYAAAKLLSHNYSELQSWPLAITAYNHGLNGMKRAVASTGSRDIAVILAVHESPSFKFASKNFYGCFLAVCDIAGNPEKYFSSVKYAQPVQFSDLVLSHNMQPSVLAASLGIGAEQLASMNPAIRQVVFQQNTYIPSGTRTHLPVAMSGAFIDSAMAAVPQSLLPDSMPATEYYRVSRGDNLAGIARRFGIKVQTLVDENDIKRTDRIYAGQVLRISGSVKEEKAAATVSFVEEKRFETKLAAPQSETPRQPSSDVKLKKAAKPEKPPVAIPQKTVAAPAEKIPDTLTETAVKRAAESPGIVELSDFRRQGLFDEGVYHLEVEISPVGNAASIRVAVDETIGHYAEWAGVPAWRLRQLNRLGNHSAINIGNRITIPGDSIALRRFVEKRIEYHLAIEEDFYSQFKVIETRDRKVVRGDNLWTLAGTDEDQVPLWLLVKFNRQMDFAKLVPGMLIWVPVVAEKTSQDFEIEKSFDSGMPDGYFYEPVIPQNKPVRIAP